MNTRLSLMFIVASFALADSRNSFAQTKSATTITVALPADAQLWVNGRRTTSTGQTRELRDSQAQTGGVYRYDLRAIVERDGRELSQERRVRLAAGQSTRVDFALPPAAQATTKALKPTLPSDDLLAQTETFQRSQFQPRPVDEGGLPELPALGNPPNDGFQPRQPDLGVPNISDDTDAAAQLAPPDVSDPAATGRFGRQFGDEPEVEPTPADSDLVPPEQPVDPMQFEEPAAPSSKGVDQSTSSPPAIWAAYIGDGHEHHLTGDTGTALHVWNRAWRMVRLQRAAAAAGPYLLYHEVDHRGFDWAYGRGSLGCHDCPVFFKPGDGARWRFVGFAQRVRPFSH